MDVILKTEFNDKIRISCLIFVETAGTSGPGALVSEALVGDAGGFREAVPPQGDLLVGPAGNPGQQSPRRPRSDRQVEVLFKIRDSLHKLEAKIG